MSIKPAFPGGLYHKLPITAVRNSNIKASLKEEETDVIFLNGRN